MPSTTSFRLGDDQSSADGSFSESDFEDFGEDAAPGQLSDKFYWYGKTIFSLLITEIVLEEFPDLATAGDLDFKHLMKTTDFPYAARLEYLASLDLGQSELISKGNSSPFKDLMVLLGAVHSSGDANMKQRLAMAMRGGPVPTGSNMYEQRQSSTRQPRPPLEEMHLGTVRSLDHDLPRYSTALKEYGDQQGCEILWSTRRVSIPPLQFRCNVTVHASVFQATARNKKLAKHLASQTACQSLGIEI